MIINEPKCIVPLRFLQYLYTLIGLQMQNQSNVTENRITTFCAHLGNFPCKAAYSLTHMIVCDD